MHRAHAQAQPGFGAAFELLPVAYSLLSGRRGISATSISVGDLRSLGDLSWLTGLLLLGTDCSRSLSLPWAACVKKVRASMGKIGSMQHVACYTPRTFSSFRCRLLKLQSSASQQKMLQHAWVPGPQSMQHNGRTGAQGLLRVVAQLCKPLC